MDGRGPNKARGRGGAGVRGRGRGHQDLLQGRGGGRGGSGSLQGSAPRQGPQRPDATSFGPKMITGGPGGARRRKRVFNQDLFTALSRCTHEEFKNKILDARGSDDWRHLLTLARFVLHKIIRAEERAAAHQGGALTAPYELPHPADARKASLLVHGLGEVVKGRKDPGLAEAIVASADCEDLIELLSRTAHKMDPYALSDTLTGVADLGYRLGLTMPHPDAGLEERLAAYAEAWARRRKRPKPETMLPSAVGPSSVETHEATGESSDSGDDEGVELEPLSPELSARLQLAAAALQSLREAEGLWRGLTKAGVSLGPGSVAMRPGEGEPEPDGERRVPVQSLPDVALVQEIKLQAAQGRDSMDVARMDQVFEEIVRRDALQPGPQPEEAETKGGAPQGDPRPCSRRHLGLYLSACVELAYLPPPEALRYLMRLGPQGVLPEYLRFLGSLPVPSDAVPPAAFVQALDAVAPLVAGPAKEDSRKKKEAGKGDRWQPVQASEAFSLLESVAKLRSRLSSAKSVARTDAALGALLRWALRPGNLTLAAHEPRWAGAVIQALRSADPSCLHPSSGSAALAALTFPRSTEALRALQEGWEELERAAGMAKKA